MRTAGHVCGIMILGQQRDPGIATARAIDARKSMRHNRLRHRLMARVDGLGRPLLRLKSKTRYLYCQELAYASFRMASDDGWPANRNPRPQSGAGPTAEILETRTPAYSALVTQLSPEGLTVRIANQSRTIPYDQLLRAKLAGLEPKSAQGKLVVELNDGSQLRCQQFTADGKNVQLTIKDDWKVSLPTSQVASCLTNRSMLDY